MDKFISRIKQNLPTPQEAFLVLSACIFPLHFWVSLVILYNIPSLILKATIWQIIGVSSYVFAFALIESLIIFGFLVLSSLLLPKWIFKDRFVYLGTSLAMIIAAIALLYNTPLAREKSWILYITIFAGLAYVILLIRRPVEKMRTSAVAERLTVMAVLYLFIDFSSIVIIILRQLM